MLRHLVFDDFNRADSLDLGANWDQFPGVGFGLHQIVNSRVRPTILNVVASELHTFSTLSIDQFAQTELVTYVETDISQSGVLLRASDAAETAYLLRAYRGSSQTSNIEVAVAGVYTEIATENAVTWTSGDIIRGEASGKSIRLYRNDTLLLAATDQSAITTLRAGIIQYTGVLGTLASNELDNFQAGNIELENISTNRKFPMLSGV